MNPNASNPSSFWRRLWRRWFAAADAGASGGAARGAGWIPIRVLSERHRPRIVTHLLDLSPNDRYLRFGYPATDEHIQRYVDGLNFERDEIFGIFNRRLQLVAMAHLAFSVDPKWSTCAEFGVSVAASQRGRGMGAKLFDRAVTYARNQGVHMLFIHALSENAAMLKIARNAGARVERDGSESEAYLSLPEATLDSQVAGMLQDRMAEIDYQLKLQARQFREWLSLMQEVRKGVREARHHNDPH
ncbi:MAG: N-acetyltransferase family protein [Limnohabitans sp.]